MNAVVIKIGGSLALQPAKLRILCEKISEYSKKHRLIVVPGGGEFADVVRMLDKRFSLSCNVSHKMAVLGMDQYGLMLSDLIPGGVTVSKLDDVKYFLEKGNTPIFLPSNLLFSEDPLENSWDVTSDSIAAYFAYRMQVQKALLITDVDGVYADDPKTNPNSKLIKKLSASELLAMDGRTSVDNFFPKLLLKLPVDCFVVNGLFPERINAILDGKDTIRTLIKSGLYYSTLT